MNRVAVYIVTAPGLEAVTAAELARHDMRVVDLGVGGLTASLTWSQLMLAHLHLSTATRILVRIGRFDAVGFGDLQDGLSDIPFHLWLPKHSAVRLNVVASGSRLFNIDSITECIRSVVKRDEIEGRDYDGGVYTMHLRISRNIATVSLDATGESMNRRSWHGAEQPDLRATLASGLLHWSGARAHRGALYDPAAGDGTVLIEAARLARRMPAGRDRAFPFLDWLPVERPQWDKLCAAADADVRPGLKKPYIAGGLNVGEQAAMTARAEAGGVAADLTFGDAPAQTAVVSHLPPADRLSKAGWQSLRDRCVQAPSIAVVSSAALVQRIERTFDDTLATSNGPSAVRFAVSGFGR